MTTDAATGLTARVLAACAAATVGAVLLSAGILAVKEEADAVLVVLPRPALLSDLPEGSGLLSWNSPFATLAARGKGTVRRAYRNGALLVLPVRASSCLDLRSG